jgi:hypothetical protein
MFIQLYLFMICLVDYVVMLDIVYILKIIFDFVVMCIIFLIFNTVQFSM